MVFRGAAAPGAVAEGKDGSVILETPAPVACFGESFASWYFKTPWPHSSRSNDLPLPFSPVCGSSWIKRALFPPSKPFPKVPTTGPPWRWVRFAGGCFATGLHSLSSKAALKTLSQVPNGWIMSQQNPPDSEIQSNKGANDGEGS